MVDKRPPKGVQEVRSVDSILAAAPRSQMCGCCGVVNGETEKSCGWCGAALADAGPPPAPLLRRVGPEPSKP